MAKIEHELIPSSCSSTILTSNSTFHCIPFCPFSCSRPMATRRSTWARCSITERTPLVQVKLIFHIMELLDFEILSMVKFPHLQGQTMTFLGLRSSMPGHDTLFLAKLSGMCFKFFLWDWGHSQASWHIWGKWSLLGGCAFLRKTTGKGARKANLWTVLFLSVYDDFFQLICILPQDRHSWGRLGDGETWRTCACCDSWRATLLHGLGTAQVVKKTNKEIDHEETLQVNIIKEYYLLLLRPHLPFLFPAQFAELYPEYEVWWKIIFFNGTF